MKFVHIADVHLGASPDRGCPWSKERREEIWETFRNLIKKVGEMEADLLLIAGDLFHRQPLLGELREVDYLFSQIPHTRVVLMAGNHDYMKRDSYDQKFSWGDNVSYLNGEKLGRVYLEEIETYVYGLSYHCREIEEPLYDNARPGDEEGYHILLAHGGDDRHIPMNMGKIRAAGFDYVAMGHIHKPQMMAENQMAYAGALVPIDRGDVGAHGYILGEMVRGRVRVRFVPFSRREYVDLRIEVKPGMAQSQIQIQAAEEIEKRGSRHIYSITISGYREEDTRYQLNPLKSLGNVVHIEDKTRVWLDYEKLIRQYEGTILENYIRQFDVGAAGVEGKALSYGVEALLQTKR